MTMIVQHNIAAQLALGELNKNNDKLRKSLEKVSGGQKINSAKDDASGYVISEKMREMVRTLDQDHQNVQNGSSLFKIAEGGINDIVEELRNLKELAINAANDTNTDIDRATIQKEFTQKYANINDVATTTNYNGITLLDGTWGTHNEWGTELMWVWDPPEDYTPGYTPVVLTDGFDPLPGTVSDTKTTSLLGNTVTNSFLSSGSNRAQVSLDFSHLKQYIPNNANAATFLDGTGFSIQCGACKQFISITFDGKTDRSTYNYEYSRTNNLARGFTIGIKSVRTVDELAGAIFNGIKSLEREIQVAAVISCSTAEALSMMTAVFGKIRRPMPDIGNLTLS